MSVYQAPNGKWRVQIGSGNKRKTKVFSSKRDAERFEASQMNALEGKPTITWQNLADAYFVGHKYKQKAETTQKSEIRASKPILSRFGEQLVVDTDDREIEEYVRDRLTIPSERTGKLRAGNTVRLELAFLANLSKIARKERIIQNSPLELVDKPKCDEKEIRINDSELAVIFKEISVLDPKAPQAIRYYYFYLLYQIGCRPSELAQLTRSNVNIERKQFRFYKTKNTRSRTVPVPSKTFDLFMEWYDRPNPEDTEYVFPSKNKNGEYKPYDFSNTWKNLKKKIGSVINPKISPHAFRHERISRWFESTEMNEGQIMELSGHITPSALNRYRHIRAERFRPVVDKLSKEDATRLTDAFIKTYKNGDPTEPVIEEDGWG